MKKFLMFSIILVFGLFFYVPAWAETTDGITSSDYLILGTVEGTGIHFEVADSEYLNVTLDSSETITLRLESVPEMVTMYIEPALAATSTQITVIGFLASTKYYKYEDDYHNLVEFTTDGNGSYSWTQDISQSHLVFIQPRKSTKFIRNDSTGGDCYLIGEWNWSARTCTLTSDVNETIQIDSSYVTLDGNGHTVTGAGTGHGIQVTWKKGVTIKNLTIEGFISGINPLFSTNSTFTGNTISNNIFGIEVVYDSINNTFTGNSISSNNIGIYLDPLSHSNTLSGNTVQYSDRGIYIHSYSNILTDNTTVSNGYGINLGYESSGNTLTNNTASNNS